jgi:hypothetical protein
MGKTIGLIMAIQDKVSPNIKKIADKIGITEKEAKKLNNQVNKLSKDLSNKLKGACTAVGIGFGAVTATAGVLINKTIEAGDRIDKMSQKIGMSRQAFQEWDFIMSQNGGSVESLQMGYKALANQMGGVQKGSKDSIGYFKKLGVAVKDNHGQLRKQEDVFNDSVRALQNMKNPTEKAIIANKLFGKSAIEMKPLLNQTSESVDTLRKRANDLGMVMSDEAVDASVKLTDSIDAIQRSFSAFGNQIGAQLVPYVQQLADELINHLPQIKSALDPVLNGLSNTIKFLMEHINGVIFVATACLSTFLAYKAINGVITTIKTLQTIIQAVTVAQGLWNAVMIANPIGLIATGIGLLIAGIVLLIKNWDTVKQKTVEFATIAVQKIQSMWEKIKPIFEKIAKIAKIAFQFTPVGMAINAGKAVAGAVEKHKKNALGTSYYSGGSTRINEFGGEIVDLPQGSRIIPHDISREMAKNSGGGINVQVTIMGNMVGNQEFLNQLADVFARKLQVAMAVK